MKVGSKPRKLSLKTNKMTVKSHFPLSLRLVIYVLSLAIFGAVVWVMAQRQLMLRQPVIAEESVEVMQEKIKHLETSNNELNEQLGRTNGLRKLDETTQDEMKRLVASLESENARLKEDLAFFEGFIPGDVTSGLNIRRAEFYKDSIPNAYKYRALIAKGTDTQEQDFYYQLVIKTKQGNEAQTLIYPQTSDNSPFKVNIKRFARIEGSVSLPEGTKATSVEFRVLDKTNIRAQTVIKLS